MRSEDRDGGVLVQFVVLPSGNAEFSSLEILQATKPQFAAAVVSRMPAMRFHSMEVEGCAVPALVQMPFNFSLNRR